MDRFKSEVHVRISASTSADVAENQQVFQRHPKSISLTTESDASAAALIKMSSVSQFVSELRHAVNTDGLYGSVRPEIVERIRLEMASGQLDSSEDVERAVHTLLRSL